MQAKRAIFNVSIVQIILICFVAIAFFIVVFVTLPVGIDWRETYRPASLALLSGKSPYSIDIFFAAPWGLLPLLPFAILPEKVGAAILFVIGVAAFAYTAYRLGAKPIAMAAFLVSPPVIHCLLNANIEWIPILGLVLPPQIGLFFISVKPQIGVAVGVFWLIEAWREGGIRKVFHIFWPISLALLASFGLFGLWPLRFQNTLSLTQDYNASLWPISLPVGLVLLATSIRQRNIRFAIGASPCLSPYVLFHAWAGALVSLVSLPLETVVAVIGLWILIIIRA